MFTKRRQRLKHFTYKEDVVHIHDELLLGHKIEWIFFFFTKNNTLYLQASASSLLLGGRDSAPGCRPAPARHLPPCTCSHEVDVHTLSQTWWQQTRILGFGPRPRTLGSAPVLHVAVVTLLDQETVGQDRASAVLSRAAAGRHCGQGFWNRGNQNWKRHMYPNVHRSTVYNSQDMEAT